MDSSCWYGWVATEGLKNTSAEGFPIVGFWNRPSGRLGYECEREGGGAAALVGEEVEGYGREWTRGGIVQNLSIHTYIHELPRLQQNKTEISSSVDPTLYT